MALRKHAKDDERVEIFKRFIGFGEEQYQSHPYSREVFEFFFKLMKITNESV